MDRDSNESMKYAIIEILWGISFFLGLALPSVGCAIQNIPMILIGLACFGISFPLSGYGERRIY